MTYFYAALGIAMFTGIMAIFDLGLALTAQQGQLAPPSDPYAQRTEAQRDDQEWMRLLNDPAALDSIGRALSSQSLCDQLFCRLSPAGLAKCNEGNVYQSGYDRLDEFDLGDPIADTGHPFPRACVLSKGDYRVLIVPQEADLQAPYGLYSCLIDPSKSDDCSFEINQGAS